MTRTGRLSLATSATVVGIAVLLPLAGWLWLRGRQPMVDRRTRDRLA